MKRLIISVALFLLVISITATEARALTSGYKYAEYHSIVTGTPRPYRIPWASPTPFSSPMYGVLVHRLDTSGADWTISVSYEINAPDTFPLPSLDPKIRKYLPGQGNIDPKIVSLSYSLTKDCVWESDAVNEILVWVICNIRYDWTFRPDQDAVTVLNNGTGTCLGYSSLTVALLQASGIPADVAVGNWGLNSGVDHAWISVLYPSAGWVMYEPQGAGAISLDYFINWDIEPEYFVTTVPGLVDRMVWEDEYFPTITHDTPSYGPPPVPVLEFYPGFKPMAIRDYWQDENGIGHSVDVKPPIRGGIKGSGTAVWFEGALDGHTFVSSAATGNSLDYIRYRASDCTWGLAVGTHSVTLKLEDVLGRTTSTTVYFLRTKLPRTRMSLPAVASATSATNRFKVSFSHTNQPTREFGPTTYTLNYFTPTAPWSFYPHIRPAAWRTAGYTTGKSMFFTGVPGKTYFIKVRAVDDRRIPGPFCAIKTVLVPLDQKSFTFSGIWGTRYNSGLYFGSSRYSNRKNSTASLRFTAKTRLQLIATKRADGGYADFYINGVKRGTINLYSATYKPRQTINIIRFDTNDWYVLKPTTGTLKIVVRGVKCSASRGFVVDIDGLAESNDYSGPGCVD